jgi:hypothetical protein
VKTLSISMTADDNGLPTILRIPYGFHVGENYLGANEAFLLAVFALERQLPVDSKASADADS